MTPRHNAVTNLAARRLAWTASWLVVACVGAKAAYLGWRDGGAGDGFARLQALAAISHRDVAFALASWGLARLALGGTRGHRRLTSAVSGAYVAFAAIVSSYVAASVVAFGPLGGFLTYRMLYLVGSVRMMRSSVAAYFTPGVAAALTVMPLATVALATAVRWLPPARGPRWRRGAAGGALVLGWALVGSHAYVTDWARRFDWRVAESAPWVFASTWWQSATGELTARLPERFGAGDLDDFAPVRSRAEQATPALLRDRPSGPTGVRPAVSRRPPNVILIVLESVAARWTGVSGGAYDTTPTLRGESTRALVFVNFYAHVGRSSNSLAAMLLSIYPKLGFRDFTEEYPQAEATSLAAVLRDHGYRTAFVTPSDVTWAGWDGFLRARGFDDVHDYHDLPCGEPVSSWGVEDRCMVDGVLQLADRDPTRPFFIMGWTQQTHHPYEPSPGVASLDLLREPVRDAYDLGRYLNVLHETDRQLARIFAWVRRAGLEDDTLIVVAGDHGQAFGDPHDSYLQGQTVYEEDVHVPLLVWSPRLYRSAERSPAVGGHVDLAPTIAELVGVPPPPDWQGRSLLDPLRAPRAYFYVAQDEFKLGVREGDWKYILDLRAGADELYDLDRDPTEQHNRAALEPERTARLRQRLAAWIEADRRQYGGGANEAAPTRGWE